MKIGILGATGAVGRQMITCLEESSLEINELRLFASERSLGKKIPFNGEDISLQVVGDDSFKDLDYVLGAVSNTLAMEYKDKIIEAGAIFVDNSSAFRLNDDVPLIVPEINGEDALKHKGVIANPNCSTIISLMAIAPIAKLSKVESIVATTFQAVSGAGVEGMRELNDEIEALRKGEDVEPKTFPKQIAYNAIAEIGSMTDNGYTTEEMKMQNEGRKILNLPELKVNCTCVRVPVVRSHSISLLVNTEKELSIEEVENEMNSFEGIKYLNDDVPSPIEVANQNIVYVGRLRKDLINEKGISLWCCGDQIRKGAASNAVSIIEYLVKNA